MTAARFDVCECGRRGGSPPAGNDLVAAGCHALRGPLTSLLAFSGFLADAGEGELTEEHRQFVEIIRRSSERVLALVNELDLLARLESGQLRLNLAPVSIPELVRTVAADQHSHSPAVVLRSESADGPPIDGDQVHLQQMLAALVLSRLEAAGPGGSVDLRAAPTSTGWQIELTDSHPGLPDDQLNQLFTAFRRPAPERSTGVSLAVSRAIAVSHGGTIQAENTGSGTTVTVRLPWGRPGR
ncbi:HAMP domain-containing sensor histidine kinase [Kribbella sp. NPDC023855]|uniref:sensor histidine kinase n=1 Tax=Kribbella sp. NPDC023855 TaxID=3154698 RepID=UPI0033F41875